MIAKGLSGFDMYFTLPTGGLFLYLFFLARASGCLMAQVQHEIALHPTYKDYPVLPNPRPRNENDIEGRDFNSDPSSFLY